MTPQAKLINLVSNLIQSEDRAKATKQFEDRRESLIHFENLKNFLWKYPSLGQETSVADDALLLAAREAIAARVLSTSQATLQSLTEATAAFVVMGQAYQAARAANVTHSQPAFDFAAERQGVQA